MYITFRDSLSVLIGLFSIGFVGTLGWFTVLGRIWARLILVLFLLFAALLYFMAFLDSRNPELINVLIVHAVLIVALMTIKT